MAPAKTFAMLAAFVAPALVGCGGSIERPESVSTGGADASPDGSSPTPIAWSPICPAMSPPPGSACPNLEGTSCEYDGCIATPACGATGCANISYCVSGEWQTGGPRIVACTPIGPNPPGCPSVQPGGECSDAGTTCVYAQAFCECNAPQDPAPNAVSTWYCGPEPGCPFPRPRIGSACTTPNQSCDYEQCGDSVGCVDGAWQPSEGLCAE